MRIADVTPDIAIRLRMTQIQGVAVFAITPGSVADNSGLRVDDVIVGYGISAVNDKQQLQNLVASTRPGESVQLHVWRNGNWELVEVHF